MSWLKKLMPSGIRTDNAPNKRRSVPEGLWEKCDRCGAVLYRPELEENLETCPKCRYHMPIRARARLKALFDPDSPTEEIGAALGPVDVLKFKDQKKYSERIKAAQKSTGERDALVALRGTLKRRPLVACAFEFAFMGGSMGSVVGERFALAAETALATGCPLVCFSATGGARMQESLFSLMQMAKTSAALGRLRAAGLPYISVMTHPTTGGVSASLAMLGDINLAEPEALIGFAGPRVIEQTVRETLPEGFQRSEFLVEHGAIDQICDRREMRERIAGLLALMMKQPQPEDDSELFPRADKRMSRRYFGTDGIRGRVGEGVISADFMLRLGNAYGHALPRNQWRKPVVIIGKDTRISNYMFEAALEAGLVAAGVDVQLMGPMPTPAVAHLTHSMRADGGIVISASHNPHYDNGIKFFSAKGEKLDDATELAIEAELEKPFRTVSSELLGKALRTRDAIGRYLEACKNSVPKGFDLGGMRIAMDCANGATYQLGPLVLRELGARVDAIGVQPNGLNINEAVGSTHPESLAAQVLSGNAALGIAFDGDGDRVLFVDAQGVVCDGDDLLFVLANDWRISGRLQGPVVGTLMTNYGLERAFEERGIGFIRAEVGDRHVHQQLIAHGAVLGGEASGHLLCLDRVSTGDGIVSALQVLEVLRRCDISLRDALHGYSKVPQQTVNVRLRNGSKPAEAPAVQAALAEALEAVAGRGRAFLRPSGTEPVVRVTVEADEAGLMQRTLDRLALAVRAAAE